MAISSRDCCSWHHHRARGNACVSLRPCLPPGRVVLAPGTAQITSSSSKLQPAQTLSLHDFHSCCVLRLFDHQKAMGAHRFFAGWKLCKWQVQQHPPADPHVDSVASSGLCSSCGFLLARHGNLLSHGLVQAINSCLLAISICIE